MNAIRPELIAGKIADGWLNRAAAAHPAYAPAQINELLWFLQYRSLQKNGLAGMVEDLIAHSPEQFGSKTMVQIGAPKNGRYSLEQCLAVWQEHDHGLLWQIAKDDLYFESIANYMGETPKSQTPRNPENFEDFCSLYLDAGITVEKVERTKLYNRAALLKGCADFNWPFMRQLHLGRAREALPEYLESLCISKGTSLAQPAYCPGLIPLLFAYMEHCAGEAEKAIAQTKVTRIVFDQLEFARTENVPVRMVGESRIGKTSPAYCWCSMRPGRARLVTVPPSNRMRDFMEAHADAFGIAHTLGTSTAVLTNLVKYVHRHSGLMVVYDESAFLIPVSYSKTTPPSRIDFVRCEVIGKDLPCAFFATPKSHNQTLDQYVKTTNRSMVEWLGRVSPVVQLPPDLDETDLMAIASKHFPLLPQPYLKLIIARAMQTEGYTQSMNFTAKRARHLARQNGRAQPNMQDVETAIEEMMPYAESPTTRDRTPAPAQARQTGPANVPTAPRRRPLQADTVPPESRPERSIKPAVTSPLITA